MVTEYLDIQPATANKPLTCIQRTAIENFVLSTIYIDQVVELKRGELLQVIDTNYEYYRGFFLPDAMATRLFSVKLRQVTPENGKDCVIVLDKSFTGYGSRNPNFKMLGW